MTFQWKHKTRYIVTENETLYPLYPCSLAIELCRNWRQIKQMHETSIDWLGFKSCPGRAVPKPYIILNRLEYSQLSSLSPCGHPGAADARYYGQNPDPPAKAIGVWLELWLPISLTLAITELRTLWWYKVINLLFWFLTKRTRCTFHIT